MIDSRNIRERTFYAQKAYKIRNTKKTISELHLHRIAQIVGTTCACTLPLKTIGKTSRDSALFLLTPTSFDDLPPLPWTLLNMATEGGTIEDEEVLATGRVRPNE